MESSQASKRTLSFWSKPKAYPKYMMYCKAVRLALASFCNHVHKRMHVSFYILNRLAESRLALYLLASALTFNVFYFE